MQEMLYVILIAQGRVITLVRPRKHSIHPSGMRKGAQSRQDCTQHSTRPPYSNQHYSFAVNPQQLGRSVVAPCLSPEVQLLRLRERIRHVPA